MTKEFFSWMMKKLLLNFRKMFFLSFQKDISQLQKGVFSQSSNCSVQVLFNIEFI